MMVERIPNGVAVLSLTGIVLYCNGALAAFLATSADRVIDTPFRAIVAAQDGPRFENMLGAALAGQASGELRFSTPDRSTLAHVSITLLPVADDPVACVVVTDLTDRERVVREDAEEAIRLKDEFLSTLSHELRTPLAAITNWSHVLRQEGLDSANAARAIEAIERNTRAQTAVVSDLLDVSQIVTGTLRMAVARVNLGEVIRSVTETLRPAARIKGIALIVSLEADATVVLGDASRVRQIVWNLLSNAIRFAPAAGRVDVEVTLADPWIELRVTDDGTGIEPAFLPHVFDRFRQADSSSTRRHTGLGLGLAIARHLVELHGGSIHARNREGRTGAVFTVRLPRPRASMIEDLQSA